MWTDLTPCPSPEEKGVSSIEGIVIKVITPSPSPLERARGEVKKITPFPSPLERG